MKETGGEGHPGREEAAGSAGQERIVPAGLAEGAEETDELEDHDQRPRRGLGHPETVEHLGGREPSVGAHRLLRHVGEHGIGAAEGDQSHLREEDADVGEYVARTQGEHQHRHRRQPERQRDRPRHQRAAPGRGRHPGHLRAEQRLGVVDMGAADRPVAAARAKAGSPARAPRNPISAAASTISGNGAPKAKIATNDSAAIARMASFFSARRPRRTTACRTMASTAALSPKNSAATNRPRRRSRRSSSAP